MWSIKCWVAHPLSLPVDNHSAVHQDPKQNYYTTCPDISVCQGHNSTTNKVSTACQCFPNISDYLIWFDAVLVLSGSNVFSLFYSLAKFESTMATNNGGCLHTEKTSSKHPLNRNNKKSLERSKCSTENWSKGYTVIPGKPVITLTVNRGKASFLFF